MIAVELDWSKRLRALVYQQFVYANWAIPTANAIGAGAQQLEAAFQALLYLFSIDPITNDPTSPAYGVGRGQQLNRLGAIVGYQRSGLTDETYRLYIRSKIRANKSNGSVNALIAVFKAMFPGAGVLYTPGGIASFTLRITGYVINGQQTVNAMRYALYLAKFAGVRAVMEFEPVVDYLFIFGGIPAQGMGSTTDATVGGRLLGAF